MLDESIYFGDDGDGDGLGDFELIDEIGNIDIGVDWDVPSVPILDLGLDVLFPTDTWILQIWAFFTWVRPK